MIRKGSVTAKVLLRNYVDAGSDLTNANDIYKGFHYALSAANSKMAVTDIDKKQVKLEEIPFIIQFYSCKFQDNTIKIWRYFDIGEGVEVPYSDSTEIVSGA